MDSLIFDLDGTLWDATQNICDSWNVVLREQYPELGQLTREAFFEQMGKPLAEIGKSLFSQVMDEQLISEVVERCCEYENQYLSCKGGRLYDDLIPTLKALSTRFRLFIVSNCQDGYIEAFIKANSLDNLFEDYECGRTGLSKAENISLIVKRNALTAPVYVGDTELDRISAESAGVPFVWASYGFGSASSYIVKLDSFTELLALNF